MKVIVGLGNPGKKYDNTRHNIGFEALDYIADKEGININTGKYKALIGTGYMGGEKVLLVKPQTFMNLSGESLRPIMDFYKLEPEDFIIIHDDIDLDVGRLRIRRKGSAGGHNGLKSIINHLGSMDFPKSEDWCRRETKRIRSGRLCVRTFYKTGTGNFCGTF